MPCEVSAFRRARHEPQDGLSEPMAYSHRTPSEIKGTNPGLAATPGTQSVVI
jgi:hypothetical protein